MKYANYKITGRGNQSKITLRSGKKGTGKVIWTCRFWGDSRASKEAMWALLEDIKEQHELLLPVMDHSYGFPQETGEWM